MSTDQPKNPSQAPDQSTQFVDQLTELLGERSLSIYLAGIYRESPVLKSFTPEVCQRYRERWLPTVFPGVDPEEIDPILEMQLDHLLLIHHQVGLLYTEVPSLEPIDDKQKLLSMITTLSGEFRRLSSLIQDSRREFAATRPLRGVAQKRRKSKHVPKGEVA